jgi:C1A family cysteine protease
MAEHILQKKVSRSISISIISAEVVLVLIAFCFGVYQGVNTKQIKAAGPLVNYIQGSDFSMASDTSATQKNLAKSLFTSNSTYALDTTKHVYGLAVSADINLTKTDSLARIILVDKNNNQYLVYESYANLNGQNSFSISNICEETCALNGITPDHLEIQINNATVAINSVSYSGALNSSAKSLGATAFSSQLKTKQATDIVNQLNQQLQASGAKWVAGTTSVSNLTYAQKKNLFSKPDGTPVDTLPNLQGFEYYKGGIFEIKNSSAGAKSLSTDNSNIIVPDSYDWRNVNGENWMTSVKNQGGAGTCWAHGVIGSLESQINLFYNQHLNLDLSEQQLIGCKRGETLPYGMSYGNYPSCWQNICYPGSSLCVISYHGISDENCDPYDATLDMDGTLPVHCDATYICSDWQQRLWENSDFWDYKFIGDSSNIIAPNCQKQTINLTENDFKKILITKGPLNSSIQSWGHTMVIIGYNTDSVTEKTIWIFKNSWGSTWGENGYAKVQVSLTDIGYGSLPMGPFTPPTNHAYWPAGFNNTVSCIDKDNDGYCNWGISEQPPVGTVCPTTCIKDFSGKYIKDCDDSNNKLGPFISDNNLNCQNITPAVPVASLTADSIVWKPSETHHVSWSGKAPTYSIFKCKPGTAPSSTNCLSVGDGTGHKYIDVKNTYLDFSLADPKINKASPPYFDMTSQTTNLTVCPNDASGNALYNFCASQPISVWASNPTTCVDSDGAKNFNAKGAAFGTSQAGNGPETKWWIDFCMNSNDVIDFTCKTNIDSTASKMAVWSDAYRCPNGCLNGACK